MEASQGHAHHDKACKIFVCFSEVIICVYVQKTEENHSQLGKPKQKRHRCRNPNKIDINTLTGEERVPVVNKRNGRKARTWINHTLILYICFTSFSM